MPPFWALCCQFGASMAIAEMVEASEPIERRTQARLQRIAASTNQIKAIQIVRPDPPHMAQWNPDQGSDFIDINMECPAKKINKKLAGSALLQYPKQVERILIHVINAVQIPITLNIRTGWDKTHQNFLEIALLAERCGIAALTIHGRTRACLFSRQAEYDSIRRIKQSLKISVIANGGYYISKRSIGVYRRGCSYDRPGSIGKSMVICANRSLFNHK